MKKERKTKRFELVMTGQEKEKLEELANSVNMTSAQLIRTLINGEYSYFQDINNKVQNEH
jgi:hypothetical protein